MIKSDLSKNKVVLCLSSVIFLRNEVQIAAPTLDHPRDPFPL
jgi:hypothetical protein